MSEMSDRKPFCGFVRTRPDGACPRMARRVSRWRILSGMAIAGGLLLVGLPGLAATASKPPPEPSVKTLIAGYAQTRQAFRSYILGFDKSMVQGYETAGEPPVRETFERLEICTDGRRWKLLETSWGGEIGVNYLSKETAARYLPELNYWDGASHYHRKPLSSSAPADPIRYRLTICTNLTASELMHGVTNRFTLNYMLPEIPFCPCQKLHPPWFLDQALPHARRVVLRPKPESVAGANCRILEAEWQPASHPELIPPSLRRGPRIPVTRTHGVFWLDPDRGCQMLRMELEWRENRAGKESVTRITRENVRLEKRDGFWLPAELDETYRGTGTRRPYKTVFHYRCRKFAANPDHRALGSFDLHEVTNGTRVYFSDPHIFSTTGKRRFHSADWSLWQDGRIVPRSKESR